MYESIIPLLGTDKPSNSFVVSSSRLVVTSDCLLAVVLSVIVSTYYGTN